MDANPSGKYFVTADACCDGYEGCVKSPTTIGTILVRVEVKGNSTADLADVDAFLSNSTLAAINPHKPTTPALSVADFAHLSNSTAISTLQLTARLESRAKPETALFRAAVPEILELAGIRHGSYNQPACVNLTHASALAEDAVTAWSESASSYSDFGNGWVSMNSSISGVFENGTAIVPRALVANTLYLQNTVNNAVSHSWVDTTKSDGQRVVSVYLLWKAAGPERWILESDDVRQPRLVGAECGEHMGRG